MKLLLELFLVFAKCSAVTFGGGYAVLPILQREIVEDRHWATEDDLMDYYAISQVTPGTIFPSMVIISIIALFLTQFENNPIVVHAFAGIRACVCILILDAVIKLGKKSVKDKGMFFIFLAILALALFAPFSPVISVLIAAAVGYFMKPYADKSIKGGSEK